MMIYLTAFKVIVKNFLLNFYGHDVDFSFHMSAQRHRNVHT